MRRKGELSAAGIDRGWPHQVVVPARLCELSLLSSVFSIRRSSAEIRIERTEIQYPNLTSPALRIS